MSCLAKQMKESLDAQQPDRRLDSDINNQKAVMIISYILIGIDLILILSIVFMRKRIQLAIGIIKESGLLGGLCAGLLIYNNRKSNCCNAFHYRLPHCHFFDVADFLGLLDCGYSLFGIGW